MVIYSIGFKGDGLLHARLNGMSKDRRMVDSVRPACKLAGRVTDGEF
jgi:hypothetical protein